MAFMSQGYGKTDCRQSVFPFATCEPSDEFHVGFYANLFPCFRQDVYSVARSRMRHALLPRICFLPECARSVGRRGRKGYGSPLAPIASLGICNTRGRLRRRCPMPGERQQSLPALNPLTSKPRTRRCGSARSDLGCRLSRSLLVGGKNLRHAIVILDDFVGVGSHQRNDA